MGMVFFKKNGRFFKKSHSYQLLKTEVESVVTSLAKLRDLV